MNPEGLEPSTNGLKVRCSTIELRVHGSEGIIAIVLALSNGEFVRGLLRDLVSRSIGVFWFPRNRLIQPNISNICFCANVPDRV